MPVIAQPAPVAPPVVPPVAGKQAVSEQDGDETVLYANFHTQDPNREKVEINVRRRCFFPEKTGCGYITVHGF